VIRVFIVDDSSLMRERLTTMLSELPEVEVVGQAQDALEAVSLIRKLKPDAVILDIRMPRGNGIDVLEKIKRFQSAPLVIVFTNYPYPQYRKRCMKAGADFFFEKATEFEKLMEVIKGLTQGSHA